MKQRKVLMVSGGYVPSGLPSILLVEIVVVQFLAPQAAIPTMLDFMAYIGEVEIISSMVRRLWGVTLSMQNPS